MRIVLAAAMAAIAGIAHAGPYDAEWNPPDRYDGPFAGTLIERRLPQHLVPGACAYLAARHNFALKTSPRQRGCSIRYGDTCTIIIIDRRYGLASPEAVRRHEIGHCNGWPADHPQ